MNSDGTGLGFLTDNHSGPDWAPDHSRLVAGAFVCSQFCTAGTLEMADWPSGTTHPAVSGSVPVNSTPAFSPDGSWLVFVHRDGNSDDRIVTMRIDGSDRTALTAGPDDRSPDWQPVNPTPVPSGYPRPKAAHVLSASLVIAYQECTPQTPTACTVRRSSMPTCSPPTPATDDPHLTVGTADSNGTPTRLPRLV